jgi:TPR repeat protein
MATANPITISAAINFAILREPSKMFMGACYAGSKPVLVMGEAIMPIRPNLSLHRAQYNLGTVYDNGDGVIQD